jgi:FkbM family methyltransferase
MKMLKKFAKRILPQSWIYFYHSVRAARKLGLMGDLFRTLRNRHRKIRLGGEAGWTIPIGRLNARSRCYCVGCGEDITFDLALMRQYGCGIYAFDPTPRAIAHVKQHTVGISNYKLAEVAIWEKADTVKFYMPSDEDEIGVSHSITNLNSTKRFIEVRTERLSDLMKGNGHDSIDLFKMDIEGAEHTVIDTIVADRLKIDILCVEFDELAAHATPERLARIKQSIRVLREQGLELFWIEGSNFTFAR